MNSKISWSDLSPVGHRCQRLMLIVPELLGAGCARETELACLAGLHARFGWRGTGLCARQGRQMSANAYWAALAPVRWRQTRLLRLWGGEPPYMAQTQATWPDVISISLRLARFSASEDLKKCLLDLGRQWLPRQPGVPAHTSNDGSWRGHATVHGKTSGPVRLLRSQQNSTASSTSYVRGANASMIASDLIWECSMRV